METQFTKTVIKKIDYIFNYTSFTKKWPNFKSDSAISSRRILILWTSLILLSIHNTTNSASASTAKNALSNTFNLNATVSGLPRGAILSLSNNGTAIPSITTNGSSGLYTIVPSLPAGSSYSIAFTNQPIGYICSITSDRGTVDQSIKNPPAITCAPNTFSISGTISGLSSGTLTLSNNGTPLPPLSSPLSGSVTLVSNVAAFSNYSIGVATQPSGTNCIVSNGSGSIINSNVSSITISCAPTGYTVSVNVTGSGLSPLTLSNNGVNLPNINTKGISPVILNITSGSSYSIAISSQPNGYNCVITGGAGSIKNSNVTIPISCSPMTYKLKGIISGLSGGGTLVISNNGINLPGVNSGSIPTNGPITLALGIPTGNQYRLTVASQPNGSSCTVNNPTGLVTNSDITNIFILCTTATYNLNASILGLNSGTITLSNNNFNLPVVNSGSIPANGQISLASSLSTGTTYSIAVANQPNGYNCSVINSTGKVTNSDISNILVLCTSTSYKLKGLITGLNGRSVTLQNNGIDLSTFSSAGTSNKNQITFSSNIPSGNTYNITVKNQPDGYNCNVTNSSGSITNSDILNIAVNCASATYNIMANISGATSGMLVLSNNRKGLAPINLSNLPQSGQVTIASNISSGSNYSIGLMTQPSGYNCTLSNSSGVVTNSDINNILISCNLPGTAFYNIKSTISGLPSGNTLVLSNNGNKLPPINSSNIPSGGLVTLLSNVSNGSGYNIAIAIQPNGYACSLTNGLGNIGSADVTSIFITCYPTVYNLIATISGLTSDALTLQNNGKNPISVTASNIPQNGQVTLTSSATAGSTYNISVANQPMGFNCSVTNSKGIVANSDITNIIVLCTNTTYNLIGTISGLTSGTLSLQNKGNSSNPVNLSPIDLRNLASKTPVTLQSNLSNGNPYLITVSPQPNGYNCIVNNSTGSITNSDISNISIACTPVQYKINATINGFYSGSLTLKNNDVPLPMIAARSGSAITQITLGANLSTGASYNITVGNSPSGFTCSVTNGRGSITNADINISAYCTSIPYSINANVSNLGSGTLVLSNNNMNLTSVTTNGTVTIVPNISTGSPYWVQVASQPNGQFCTVSNGGSITSTLLNSNLTANINCVSTTYTITAAVTGLNGSLILSMNGATSTNITKSGLITVASNVSTGTPYWIQVASQPNGQTCIVNNGGSASSLIANANINAQINCLSGTTYNMKATVSGIVAGTSLTLTNNGSNSTPVTSDGPVSLASNLATGKPYWIQVSSQPAGSNCSISGGGTSTTTIANQDINATVTCIPTTYNVGAIISGLSPGAQLTLNDNGANSSTVTKNGLIILTSGASTGTGYQIQITSQPNGQTCSVLGGGSGSSLITNADITATINCTSGTKYNVKATVANLSPGTALTLSNNGFNPTQINTDGTFTISSNVSSGTPYWVQITSQPNGLTCSVISGGGSSPSTISNSDINATVDCGTPATYNVYAKISGLLGTPPSDITLNLDNNGTSISPSIPLANGAAPIAQNQSTGTQYSVQVSSGSQPNGYNCTVFNSAGSITNADIYIPISCVATTYSVSATITGLNNGLILTLNNNSGPPIVIASNGIVTLSPSVPTGAPYLVQIASQPNGQTCTVSGGGNSPSTIANSNIMATVNCTGGSTFNITASLSGLTSGSLTLNNNGVPAAPITSSGTSTLASAVPAGTPYSLSVAAQPANLFCFVINGNGTVTQTDVSISISCIPQNTLSTGSGHSCGINTLGVLKCWGQNTQGQLGDGTKNDSNTPIDIDSTTSYASISAGVTHTCGITTSQTLKCWGNNTKGQLGDGTTIARSTPTVIDGSTSYATAIAGNQTTCGITTTGVLKCWGNNSNGQIGDYTTTNKLLPTIIDFGTLYSLVSPGNLFTCGITTGGVAKCWGDNSSGQLGDGTTTERHRPNYVNDSDTYSTVSTGKGHSTCGVTSAGTLKCWGQNTQGQLGDSTTTGRKAPTTINPPNTLYASVAEGSDYACAITTSGALNCWGNYDHSQINSSSSPVAVDASNPYNYITGGGSHICGITQAGIYTCWGLNTYGQLGDSTNQDSNSPISLNL
jgi:hypothetical protein